MGGGGENTRRLDTKRFQAEFLSLSSIASRSGNAAGGSEATSRWASAAGPMASRVTVSKQEHCS